MVKDMMLHVVGLRVRVAKSGWRIIVGIYHLRHVGVNEICTQSEIWSMSLVGARKVTNRTNSLISGVHFGSLGRECSLGI